MQATKAATRSPLKYADVIASVTCVLTLRCRCVRTYPRRPFHARLLASHARARAGSPPARLSGRPANIRGHQGPSEAITLAIREEIGVDERPSERVRAQRECTCSSESVSILRWIFAPITRSMRWAIDSAYLPRT
jgi:hypothetical protein